MASEILLDAVTAIAPDGKQTPLPLLRDGRGDFPNGTVWSPCAVDTPDIAAVAVAAGQGRYVAVGDGILCSEDGKSWETVRACNGSDDGYGRDILYRAGVWVALMSHRLLWSDDGRTWNSSNLSGLENQQWRYCLAWKNGVFCASTGSGIYYSADGKSWTLSDHTQDTGVLTVFRELFVAFHRTEAGAYFSPDGVHWTEGVFPRHIDGDPRKQAFSRTGTAVNVEDSFLVSLDDNGCVASTVDGRTWVSRFESNGSATVTGGCAAFGAAFLGNVSYIVRVPREGPAECVHTGSGWANYAGIAAGPGVVVGITKKGPVYTTDGRTWLPCPPCTVNLESVQNFGGIWIGTEHTGKLWFSVAWEPS